METICKTNSDLKEDLSFYNPKGSNLRKAQMRMLNILDVCVRICEKHKIDYWLYADTALGARRQMDLSPGMMISILLFDKRILKY